MDRPTVERLAAVRLFAGIAADDIPHMLGCIGGTEQRYPKGAYLFMEGDDLLRVGVILSGTVQMVKEDVWGGKALLAVLTPGELLGESFVCGDQTASTVSFLAAGDCRILFLPFRRLLTTCGMTCQFHQRLIENMVVMLAAKNVGLMNRLEVLSPKTIRERILVWLSQQAQEQGGPRFTSSLGRVELADYLGVDRSALTRELGNMRRDGLVDFDRNTFELKHSAAEPGGQ